MKHNNDPGWKEALSLGGLLVGSGILGFLATRYRTSKSHEYLARTGLLIKDIQIGKKFIQWPFQNIQTIKMAPESYKFSVNAMSKEKMEFNFPAVFTIGPRNDMKSLVNYSRYLLNQDNFETNNLIRGIIEGETRSLSANQSIEDIFTARGPFKNEIILNVQTQLEQYGLEIYNANIEELKDGPGSNYFGSLSQRIKAEAENRAKIEVSEQKKLGDVGSKEREAETRQKTALLEAEATISENNRKQEIIRSVAEMQRTKFEQDYIIKEAQISSEQKAQSLQMTLEKEVEEKRMMMETNRERATQLSKTVVNAEKMIKEAEAEANSIKIRAEAQLYNKQKEAEGILALYEARSKGLEKLVSSFGGNMQALLSHMMIENGIYEKIAKENANAIQGLNPKINVWSSNPYDSMDTIKNLGKSIIPMLDIMKDQTNYSLPEWIVKEKNE